MKPIFHDLTKLNILRDFLHGPKTQMNHSSVKVAKNRFFFFSLKVGVSHAVLTFNTDNLERVKSLEKLCNVSGDDCVVVQRELSTMG